MAQRRLFAVVTAALFVAVLAFPALATTTTVVGETTTTAVAIVPAVSTEVTEPPETQPDWTYRFFIPTLLVIAAVVVIFTVVRYFTNVVRKRYRVVR